MLSYPGVGGKVGGESLALHRHLPKLFSGIYITGNLCQLLLQINSYTWNETKVHQVGTSDLAQQVAEPGNILDAGWDRWRMMVRL